jgi:ribosome-binding factor A
MAERNQCDVRRARKESLIYRELSTFFMQITQNDAAFSGLFINAVKFSPDRSSCNIFFAATGGEEDFKERLPKLILYKPALRKAIAQSIQARYTPQLVFKYDTQFEKQNKIDTLFEQLKVEGRL